MKAILPMAIFLLINTSVFAETINFDKEKIAAVPQKWISGVSGHGTPHWSVEFDDTAPSKPNVLKQSGEGTYPWCVRNDVKITDGYVEVKFRPLSGSEDQAGGVVWRWIDGDNYYVARANALENNIALYYTEKGTRKTIKYVEAPVSINQWHTLKVSFSKAHISVALDGKPYIEQEDDHISGSGSVGVWTKADSVTAFDDFNYEGK